MMTEEEKQDDIETPEAELENTGQKPEAEDDFKEKYFRLLAEMENSRKRMQKEKHEMTRFAIENIFAEVITPLDTFESALGFTSQMNEETKNWAKGFEMILSQFKEILNNHNVTPFHSKGEIFDPHRHEAVEMEETTEHRDGLIIEEFLKGYKSGDRILRAARVKVAKTPKKKEEEQEGENHDSQEEK